MYERIFVISPAIRSSAASSNSRCASSAMRFASLRSIFIAASLTCAQHVHEFLREFGIELRAGGAGDLRRRDLQRLGRRVTVGGDHRLVHVADLDDARRER